jgi:polyhydroxyalkanoate synthesis regulator protein
MALRIKKYGNRKLYDEGASSYISMLDLAKLVSKDNNVVVTCDRTGRDLTLETLARALYERLKTYSDEDVFLRTGSNRPQLFSVSKLTSLLALLPADSDGDRK